MATPFSGYFSEAHEALMRRVAQARAELTPQQLAERLRAAERIARLSTCSIYFIAVRVFPPDLSPQQWVWLEGWMDEVRKSIQAGETIYLRDPAFDRLLSLLFPEMAAGLAKPFGKLKHGAGLGRTQEREGFVRPVSPDHPRSRSDGAGPKLLDTRPGEGWLTGRDLDAWKRAHPEAARDWLRGVEDV